MKMLDAAAETLSRISKDCQLVAWGAGETLDGIINNFREFEFENKILYIVDSNQKKWNTLKCYYGKEIPIKSPDSFYAEHDKNTVLIIASIYYQKILEQLEQANVTAACYRTPELKYDFQFEIKQRMEKEPIRDDLIIFKSLPDYTDNARVLFDYMIRNKMNEKYQLVWAAEDETKLEWMKKYQNVDVYCASIKKINTDDDIEKKTEIYYRYFNTAKIFFITHVVDWFRDRKPGQIGFNLWHGNGFKSNKIAINHKDSFEYTCALGPLCKEIQRKHFCCDESKVVITGHPKTDLFFTCNIKKIKKELNIDGYRKVIVWMPTFRRSYKTGLNENTIDCETGIPVARTFFQLEQLNKILHDRNMILVIKLHQAQLTEDYTHALYTNIKVWDSDVLLDRDIQPNELLACADALISDYSSAAVDFLYVDRMMGFAIDDYDEFTKGRTFLVEPLEDYLPGYIIKDMDELTEFILDVDNDNDKMEEKRKKLFPQMRTYCDGNSSKRILEFLRLE